MWPGRPTLCPQNVRCRYQLKKKLNLFKLTPFMVNSVLAEGKGGFIRAKLVCKTLENFFASADEELTIDHVPIWCKNSQGQRVMVEQSEKLVSRSVSLELRLGRLRAWSGVGSSQPSVSSELLAGGRGGGRPQAGVAAGCPQSSVQCGPLPGPSAWPALHRQGSHQGYQSSSWGRLVLGSGDEVSLF